MNLLQKEKNRFLANEFFMLSWSAALQRNKTFASIESEKDGSSDSSVNKIKAGTTQKILNMMLKYCWCAGWINTPPDFPIDSHNLKALLNLHNSEEFIKSWTKKIKEIKD